MAGLLDVAPPSVSVHGQRDYGLQLDSPYPALSKHVGDANVPRWTCRSMFEIHTEWSWRTSVVSS